jgi:hypothetical protein
MITKAYSDKDPSSALMIGASPKLLRELANKIEHKERLANPGDIILQQLSARVTLAHLVEKSPTPTKLGESEDDMVMVAAGNVSDVIRDLS